MTPVGSSVSQILPPPEIMYTRNVPQPLRDHYNNACSDVDPFAAHWRLHREVGVRTLSKFKGMLDATDPREYKSIFGTAANISDEMGLFIPTIGASSIGLFLEREQGDFSEDEVERAKLAFPILSSLSKAHISQLFDRIHQGDSSEWTYNISTRPILVQDRYGIEIFSSASWKDAVQEEPDLIAATRSGERDAPIMLRNYVLNISRVGEYFPLAPGGRMLTLTPCPTGSDDRIGASKRIEFVRCLTPRERDILNLILDGSSTSDISQALSISKGSVKNNMLRIYKKAKTKSRMELICKFLG